jgi:hypothetical protein
VCEQWMDGDREMPTNLAVTPRHTGALSPLAFATVPTRSRPSVTFPAIAATLSLVEKAGGGWGWVGVAILMVSEGVVG